jgi:hypothetical protein
VCENEWDSELEEVMLEELEVSEESNCLLPSNLASNYLYISLKFICVIYLLGS